MCVEGSDGHGLVVHFCDAFILKFLFFLYWNQMLAAQSFEVDNPGRFPLAA
jgi:hypothetical protein